LRRLITLITLALCLGLASSASAAPRSFFGVVPFGDPSLADLDRMGNGKVGQVRINFFWGAVQGLEAFPYDWTRYDAIVKRAAENNIRVFPTIYGSPGWAADAPKHPPRPEHRDEFREFLTAAAERYGPGGTFWTLNPLVPTIPIVDWQMWNEVNSPTFWYSKPKAKQYKPLLQAAQGIKSVNPGAKIVLAGLFKDPAIKNSIPMAKYLSQLYRTGAKPLFDAIAVHPYALTPRQALETVDQARRVMRRHKDGKTRAWITEIGWASSGIHTPITVSPKKQARFLRKTFRLSAKSRKRRRIAGVFWFCFKDQQPKFWIYRTGLLTRTGAAKPSWRAFVRFTGGSPG
jgi:polysaccharide biosynthesis protein PslG